MKRHTPSSKRISAARQKGAAAIEFAFVFVIFFGVLYGIFSYAFVMLLQQGLSQAAAEGARAALKVDRLNFKNAPAHQAAAGAQALKSAQLALSWLPANVVQRITIDQKWQRIDESLQSGSGKTYNVTRYSVTITTTYPDYAKAPILPILELPGLGPIPKTPQNLIGQATVVP